MATRSAMILLLALTGSLAGCSGEDPAPAPALAVGLPTADVLPHRFNDDCGCVRDGQCAMVEEVLGSSEIRNLSCRWLRPNAVALCRYEGRFVALYPDEGGDFVERPEPWEKRTLRAILLPDGRWCSG